MRKGLALVLCFCAGLAVADVRIPGGANYQIVGRGLTWAGTGVGAVNNNFIMDVVSPSSGMCLAVANNDTGSHSLTVNAFATSDLSQVTYTGSTGKWNQVPFSPAATNTIPASSMDQFYVNTTGAAHVTLAITGGSGTGTADIFISQTANFCGGGPTVSGCNKSQSVQVATATTSVVVPTPPTGQFIHVCAYQFSGSVTATAAITLANGTVGTCAAPGTTVWLYNAATGNGPAELAVPAPSQLFQTTVATQPLCATNAGTGANQAVSVSYAIF
jgi:hypothetical protein